MDVARLQAQGLLALTGSSSLRARLPLSFTLVAMDKLSSKAHKQQHLGLGFDVTKSSQEHDHVVESVHMCVCVCLCVLLLGSWHVSLVVLW